MNLNDPLVPGAYREYIIFVGNTMRFLYYNKNEGNDLFHGINNHIVLLYDLISKIHNIKILKRNICFG